MNQNFLFPENELVMDHPEKQVLIANCMSEILQELFLAKGVTQREVSEATGIAESTLSDWLNGGVTFQHADKRLLVLANFFGVTIEYLLFGIGADPEEKEEKVVSIELIKSKKLILGLLRKFYGKLPENLENEARALGYINERGAIVTKTASSLAENKNATVSKDCA